MNPTYHDSNRNERHTLRSVEFSSSLPDVLLTVSGDSAQVAISIDGEEVYSETLYAVGHTVTLEDLSELVTPYARQKQTVALEIQVGNDEPLTAQVVYCTADLGDAVPADFLSQHYLSILMGAKVTALGRLELLSLWGSDKAQCTAHYSDGTTETFSVETVEGYDSQHYKVLDVSPDLFGTSGKTLTHYTVTAGARQQTYEIDHDAPDCAPILVFVNSFGMDELAYCTGKHSVAPTYKRSAAYIGRLQRNYRIDETRAFKADTGVLTTAMANWWDDVFRSDSVRIVNFFEGHPNVGKDLLITDSKSEYSNEDDAMPRFTFTYQYAQRNHNVVTLLRAGRIFDNTFDNTFN